MSDTKAKKQQPLTPLSAMTIRKGEQLWDSQVTGLGLRAGTKRTVWHIKVPVVKDGRRWSHKCDTLGDVTMFTLEQARIRAKIRIGQILDQYGDPDRERIEREANALTLATAWKSYVQSRRQKNRRARTIEGYESELRHFADWKLRPLKELGSDAGRAEIRVRFSTISRTSGRAAANNAFRVFRAVWNYAAKETSALPPNPTKAIDFHELEPRDDAYEPEEIPAAIAAIWKLDNIRAGLHFTMFLTGIRGGGLMEAKREDFDRKARTLLIKNAKGKPFLLPLSTALISLLDTMTVFADESFPNNDFLFPAHSADNHIIEPRADLPPPAAMVRRRQRQKKNPKAKVKTHFWRFTYTTMAEEHLGISEADGRLLTGHIPNKKRDPHTGYKRVHLPRLIDCQERVSRGLLKLAGLGEDYKFTTAAFLEHRKAEVGQRRLEKAKADPEMAGLI